MRWLSEGATRVTDAAHRVAVRSADPGDDYLIALAAANKAVLVSGDKHLLALRDQIPVYSPRDFLEVIEPG